MPTPAGQPVAPQAVPINLRVTLVNQNRVATAARLRDACAGAALGMGCFTGQTQRAGMLKTLPGPTPTRARIQADLDSLVPDKSASGAAPDLPFPLTNADVRLPHPPAAKRPAVKK